MFYAIYRPSCSCSYIACFTRSHAISITTGPISMGPVLAGLGNAWYVKSNQRVAYTVNVAALLAMALTDASVTIETKEWTIGTECGGVWQWIKSFNLIVKQNQRLKYNSLYNRETASYILVFPPWLCGPPYYYIHASLRACILCSDCLNWCIQ